MEVSVRKATVEDTPTVAALVNALTLEICEATHSAYFDGDRTRTAHVCQDLIAKGYYTVLLVHAGGPALGVVTMTENHALYAGGLVGTVQEFYVAPDVRSKGVGGRLIEAVFA